MMNYRGVLGGESEETPRISQVAGKTAVVVRVCVVSALRIYSSPSTSARSIPPMYLLAPPVTPRIVSSGTAAPAPPIRGRPPCSWRGWRRAPWSTPGGRSERTRVSRSRGERSGGSEILFSLNCSRSVGILFLRHLSLAAGQADSAVCRAFYRLR